MELHILEHRVRVLSLARPGLWLYTHPLIKLLFLPRRNRCAPGFRGTDWGGLHCCSGRGQEIRVATRRAEVSGSGRGGPFHTTPAAIWPGLTLPGTAAYPGPAKAQTAWGMQCLTSRGVSWGHSFLTSARASSRRLPSGQRGQSRGPQVRCPGAVAAGEPLLPPKVEGRGAPAKVGRQ